MLQTEVVEKIL